MKTNLTRTLMLTAVALAGAAAAYGQYRVSANVPFAFRTFGGVQAAGAYTIKKSTSGQILMLQNQETRNSTVLGTATAGESNGDRPRLVFRCGDESGCMLSAVTLADGIEYKLPGSQLKASEVERIAVVYFERTQAE